MFLPMKSHSTGQTKDTFIVQPLSGPIPDNIYNSIFKNKNIKRINELKSIIDNANYCYYAKDDPVMSDYEFDLLFQELIKLEKEHPDLTTDDSPTHRVGGVVLSHFETGKHIQPMLSIKTETFIKEIDSTEDGITAFVERITNAVGVVDYVAELKFDGLAINLLYKNRVLVHGLTRGDGINGENVTSNIKTIPTIPLRLPNDAPDLLEVRGEVFMGKDVFNNINIKQRELGLKELVNTRNAAAGSLRQLDSSLSKQRKLSFYAYGVGVGIMSLPNTQYEILKQLQRWGFPINNETTICHNVEDLSVFFKRIEVLRPQLNFDIDGVVFKVNNINHQETLGFISREPKWAIAQKFLPDTVTTKVLAIDIQVGRTGKLTPVAKLVPVFVGGTTISSVTLHNESEAQRKDIRVGDEVVVQRAGDVIPEIVSYVRSSRTVDAQIFIMPDKCPICGSPVTILEEEANHRCTSNLICPAQIKASFIHYGQRTAMNIDGFGDSLVDQLVDNNLVKNLADIYRLTKTDLMKIPRMGEKSCNNILEAIKISKVTTLKKFLFALGIRQVGEGTSLRLTKIFRTLDRVIDATYEELLSVEDIGPTTAESIFNFFKNNNNLAIVRDIENQGLIITPELELISNKLTGKVFAITGSFNGFKRPELKALIEQNDGKVSGSVGKLTTHLVAGSEAGSKLVDAQKLNIPILSEVDFIKLLAN